MDTKLELLCFMDTRSKQFSEELSKILEFQHVLSDWEISRSIEWMLEKAVELMPEEPSLGQKAVSNFLKFLARTRLKNIKSIELVAWICISLALKVSGVVISIEDLEKLMESRFNQPSIITTEVFITQKLMWDVNTPTVYEIQEVLLEPLKDAECIIQQANDYVKKCYTSCTHLSNGLLVLAMSSAMHTMLDLALDSAYNEFIALYSPHFSKELGLAKKINESW